MSQLSYAGFCNAVTQSIAKHTSHRKGQCLYNCLHHYRPDLAKQIHDTERDPFYAGDDVYWQTYQWIYDNWESTAKAA